MVSNKVFASFSVALCTLAIAAGAVMTGFFTSTTRAASVTWNVDAAPTSNYTDYGLYPVHSDPLFDINGKVNGNVLKALHNQLDAIDKQTTQPNDKGDWIETTGVHFSERASGLTNKDSASLIIKLFPTINTNDSNVGKLTEQWFQLVYRAQDVGGEERDVLTLWAIEPYRTSAFNSNSNETLEKTVTDDAGASDASVIHGAAYTNEGNYSTSIVRNNILSDYNILTSYFPYANQYFAKSSDMPGDWQASFFQTGTNESLEYYESNGIGGSSGYGYNSGVNEVFYSLLNGMDEYGQNHTEFVSTVNTTKSLADDKMWIPSAFETVYMGKDKESGNGNFGYDGDITADSSDRYGLWRLNGYDRAFADTTASYSWLRSACSNEQNIDHARSIYKDGNGIGNYVDNTPGVRPAFNLDLAAIGHVCDDTCECNGEGESDPGKYELYHVKETVRKILDGWWGIYDVLEGMEDHMVRHLADMDAIFENPDATEIEIHIAVIWAYALIEASEYAYEQRYNSIIGQINDLQFDPESFAEYQEAKARVEYLLLKINGENGYLAQIAALESRIVQLNEHIAGLQGKISDLDATYQITLSLIDNLNIQIYDKNQTVQQLQQTVTELEEQVLEVTIKLEIAQNDYYNATTLISVLMTQIAMEAKDNDEYRQMILDLQAEIIALERGLYDAQQKYDAALEKIRELKEKIEAAIADGGSTTEIIENLYYEITTITRYLTNAKEEYDQAIADINKLLLEIEDRNDRVKNLQAMIAELDGALEDLYEAQKQLQLEQSNRGLDPKYIGIIVAICIIAVGTPIVVFLATRKRKPAKASTPTE